MSITRDIAVRLLLSDRGRLLGYIRSIVRDEHIAEDVFQAISILVIEKCDEIADEAHFRGWIRTAARLEALSAGRKRASAPQSLDGHVHDLLDSTWQENDPGPDADRMSALRTCLEKLSPYARKLVQLRYVEGVSGQELANRVGRKLGTASTGLSRAHNSLAQCHLLSFRFSDDSSMMPTAIC